jgi:hypothetical protein
MAKYIECSCCGKRIEFGRDVYKYPGHALLHCSYECFTDTYGETHYLNEELAEDCWCTIYDDEARRREIEAQIEKHMLEIESLRRTLELLTTQN